MQTGFERFASILVFTGGLFSTTSSWGEMPALLVPAQDIQCPQRAADCQDLDAIVFVHGIYGGNETFKNTATNFDWPAKFPRMVGGRSVDIYRLMYESSLLSWAKEKNPRFEAVAKAVFEAMAPLRKRKYRSIGFIAHSLGGNIVSTYIHMAKTSKGHPQRSQHGFIITLASPVLGSQVADLATVLKSVLGMDDDLLTSLKEENLYLRMLQEFRQEEEEKENRYLCRPVHLHAAYEQKYLGPLLIVTPESAAVSISQMAKSPVVGFLLDHSQIAKPAGLNDEVHLWVIARVKDEFRRIGMWETAHRMLPSERQLCERMEFIQE